MDSMMNAGIVSLLFFCFVFEPVSSHCQSVTAQDRFNIRQYLGRWYYYMHSPVPFIQDECSSSDYSISGQRINILKEFRRNNGQWVTKNGHAYPQSGNLGAMEVEFRPGGGNLWVLETDYLTYSVIWTCIRPAPHIRPHNIAWIFSRDPRGPGSATIDRLKLKLQNEYGVQRLVPVNQNNC